MSYLWYWPAGGWDYDRWKARHPWQPVTSAQSSHKTLQPVLRRGQTLDDWLASRQTWLGVVRELIGALSDVPPARMRWDVVETRRDGALHLQRLRYSLTDDEWGYAWLLTADDPARTRRPAVIALHQTVPQGKDEPVGLNGDGCLAYGKQLAERGFAVLAPDAIGFGERARDHPHARYHSADQFFAAHPDGSVMAKMVYDVSRAVDLLEQLPGVDATRVGCIGHSHGAYGTLFAMLFEPRISAGVISCGFTTLRRDPTPERWWRMTALIPRLGHYEDHTPQTPLDFHHLLALVAPRALMVVVGLHDSIFPNTGDAPHVMSLVRQVYRRYGAADQLHHWIFNGPHCFPTTARTRSYHMLEEVMSG